MDRLEHHWGKAEPNAQVKTAFRIKNQGDRPLRLGEAKASCGCTVARLERSLLSPGESVSLEVALKVPEEVGTVHHFVHVGTNDPNRDLLKFHLAVECWKGVVSAPPTLELGEVKLGRSTQRLLQLRAPDGAPFQINHCSSDLEGLRWKVVDAGRSTSVHRIEVTYETGDKLGSPQGALRIVTDRPESGTLVVPVRGRVTGPIAVSPVTLNIAAKEIGRPVRKSLLVRSTEEQVPLEVGALKALPPWGLVEVERTELRKGLVRIDIDLIFPKGRGNPSGALIVEATAPGPFSVRVPLLISGWSLEPSPPGEGAEGETNDAASRTDAN